MPDPIAAVIIILHLGSICGCLYCLYFVCFRWTALVQIYGHFDLAFWVNCIVTTFGIVALVVAATYLVIWDWTAN
jgi:hypothetical protein